MKKILMVVLVILGAAIVARADDAPKIGLVRNGGFGARGALPPYFVQKNIDDLRKAGWKCPDIADWAQCWGCYGINGVLEFPTAGGADAGSFARLSGKDAWLTGYDGHDWHNTNQICTIWLRGKGRFVLKIQSYGLTKDGETLYLTKPGEVIAGTAISVDTGGKWGRYRVLLVKTPVIWAVHPWLNVAEGTLDIDEVDITPSTPALDRIVAEEDKLYGTGALIENLNVAQADEVFQRRRAEYRSALKAFQAAAGKLDKPLVESVNQELSGVNPYVLTDGITSVQTASYNEMIAATQVLNNLAGKKTEAPAAIKATEAVATKIDYSPGVRPVKKDTVMVTAIQPNKILYEEGENASAQVKLKNTSATQQQVNLAAVQYADLEPGREVARGSMSLAPGAENTWTISFNVGPETYGRALEVVVTDSAGKELDRWQEYYQAAREWLRVQMHSGSRYNNMSHFFESEPTDWGVQLTNAEVWRSGAGYAVNPTLRLDQVRYWHSSGKKFTFYQNNSFQGIMGYEEMRKHPEYVLYDPNGQFAMDPTYGGYPSPMELASPIEIGPKRKPVKPYLDRSYTGWQHAAANFAREDMVEYGARCIRDYAKKYEFDGVFIDGQIVVNRGYGYDGRMNVPADLNEIARVNARIQDLYCRILKKENPYFGTWYNYSITGVQYYRTAGWPYGDAGAGYSPGESDAWIRALTGWKNNACLMEWAGALGTGDGLERRPKDLFGTLCKNRDYTVQKYGGNTAIGYFQGANIEALSSDRSPGPNKWGWPTINYFMAQMTATQHHVIMCVRDSPSMEPTFQFQTRYSSLLWAPDIKLVPEAEKLVTVKTPEAVWWKQTVYRRNTKDGYDLIVHLIRIPPTPLWDLNWVDEPAPLDGVRVTADIGNGSVTAAYACRPYQFEEPQQAIQQALQSKQTAGKVAVTTPPFRYHTMVVLRCARGK